MGRKNSFRVRALEERRKKNYTTTNADPLNNQRKITQGYGNQSHYPEAPVFNDDFQRYFFEDYDDYCDPFDYENYEDFCNPFNYAGLSDSDSFFDEEDKESLQGVEDVDIEALEEGDDTSGAMLRLPLDIFLDILSRLPIGSLARCRSVCKTWRKIVHHPRFTSMHHNKAIQVHDSQDASTGLVLHVRYSGGKLQSEIYLLEHDIRDNCDHVVLVKPRFFPPKFEFEVVGSCNGLLCLSEQFYYDPIYICNPIIGEYVKLPPTSKRTNFDIVSGFGYDEVANEYKVVRMLFDSIDYISAGNTSFKLEAEVYTLGSGMWRKLGDVPYPLRGKSSASVFVSGALHWITDDYIGLNVSELIIAFNVSTENFSAVPSPPDFHYGPQAHFSLGDLRRSLCLFDYSSNDQIEIWVMKDYGVKDSWVKDYAISRQEIGLDKLYFHPIKVLSNGEMLLVYNSESLICYDPKRRQFRVLGKQKLPSRFEAITHMGSFVSLRDIVGPTTSTRNGNNRRWCRTLYPLPSSNPELDMEDWILDYEVQQLAAFMDSGVDLSDMYHDF